MVAFSHSALGGRGRCYGGRWFCGHRIASVIVVNEQFFNLSAIFGPVRPLDVKFFPGGVFHSGQPVVFEVDRFADFGFGKVTWGTGGFHSVDEDANVKVPLSAAVRTSEDFEVVQSHGLFEGDLDSAVRSVANERMPHVPVAVLVIEKGTVRLSVILPVSTD